MRTSDDDPTDRTKRLPALWFAVTILALLTIGSVLAVNLTTPKIAAVTELPGKDVLLNHGNLGSTRAGEPPERMGQLPLVADEKTETVSDAALIKVAKGPVGLVKEIDWVSPAGLQKVVLAHTPTDIELPTPRRARAIVFQYGMSELEWNSGDKSGGGCFAATPVDGAGLPLGQAWRSCLQPVVKNDDRTMKVARISLPTGARAVHLTTSSAPGGSTQSGWTYWGRVTFVAR